MKPERILFFVGAVGVLVALAYRQSPEWQGLFIFLALLALNFALMLGWSRNKS